MKCKICLKKIGKRKLYCGDACRKIGAKKRMDKVIKEAQQLREQRRSFTRNDIKNNRKSTRTEVLQGELIIAKMRNRARQHGIYFWEYGNKKDY